MSSDWDEIKRLAADFQKAQLTSTLQKLSEHNCVEIVTLLLQKKLIEVVFTNDGKEYVTPHHLEREIQDELYMNGGRVNLVEVSKSLNVDLSQIEEIALRIASDSPNIHFMLGQLIDEDYITHIAQEINEKLAQKGEISIAELTQRYDLPTDFLQHQVVEKHLGKIIKGRQDPGNPQNFFTQAYVHRCKAKIRGALAAITSPTNVSTILQQINVQERIFHSLLDEISPEGQVTSKQANALYVPHIYAKMQAEWVQSFYKQNGFLEYAAISKLGITDPKQFIKKQFPKEDILYLKRCAVGNKLIDLTVLSALNECHASKSYVDLSTILPSNMSEEDLEEVYNVINTQRNPGGAIFVYMDGIVFSQEFLNELVQPCQELALNKAKASIDSGAYQQHLAEIQLSLKAKAMGGGAGADFDDESSRGDKREERRKKASSGKAGGGGQGRETKTKSTKKHQRGGRGGAVNDSDDDDDQRSSSNAKKAPKPLELIKEGDLSAMINKKLESEGLDHLTDAIAHRYHKQMNQLALAKAQELYELLPQNNRRQTHAAVQENLNSLLVDIRLYEKGLKLFPPLVQDQLVKYLLKSLGNDICNELTVYVANECNLQLKGTTLNVDQRNKVAQECDPEYKAALLELNKSLNKSIEDFVLAVETALKACSMIIKKADKKKDRQVVHQYRDSLIQQLKASTEAAMVLHLSSLILFTTLTGCMLHASGKFVAQILGYLSGMLSGEQNALLMDYHDLVLKFLQAEANSPAAAALNEQLAGKQSTLKEMVLNIEKPSPPKSE